MRSKSQLNEPKLRFREFNGEWKHSYFENHINLIRGKKPKPLSEYVNNEKGIPWIKISDVNGKYLKTTEQYFDVNKINKTMLVKSNSLIYTIEGSPCIPFFIEFDAAIDNHLSLVTLKKDANIDFLYYMFLYYKKHFSNFITGSSLVSINIKHILKYPICLPSIYEQNKISMFLILLDKQIELWERKLQLNELILNKIGQLITKLIYTCDNVKLKKYLINENKNAIKDFIDTTPISISLWGKGFKKSNLVPKISNTGRPYYIRKINELIIGSQNFHNGSIAILDDQYHNPVMSNAILSFNIVNINPTLLEFILLLPKYQYYLKNRCDGTGQKEFSIKSILDLDFFKISPDLENNFVANIYAIKRNIKLMNKKILILIKKKSFYLHNLFL